MVPGGIFLEEVYEANKRFSNTYTSCSGGAQIHEQLSLPLFIPLDADVSLAGGVFFILGDREKGGPARQQRTLLVMPAQLNEGHASQSKFSAGRGPVLSYTKLHERHCQECFGHRVP